MVLLFACGTLLLLIDATAVWYDDYDDGNGHGSGDAAPLASIDNFIESSGNCQQRMNSTYLDFGKEKAAAAAKKARTQHWSYFGSNIHSDTWNGGVSPMH